jgi:hypothetical protein
MAAHDAAACACHGPEPMAALSMRIYIPLLSDFLPGQRPCTRQLSNEANMSHRDPVARVRAKRLGALPSMAQAGERWMYNTSPKGDNSSFTTRVGGHQLLSRTSIDAMTTDQLTPSQREGGQPILAPGSGTGLRNVRCLSRQGRRPSTGNCCERCSRPAPESRHICNSHLSRAHANLSAPRLIRRSP